MGGVELLRAKAEDFEWDPLNDTDPFGFNKPSGKSEIIEVQVALNIFSHSQMIRQFPTMKKYISKHIYKNFPFLLSISVWDIQPIARFCAGLLNKVKIIGSKDALSKIDEYVTTTFTTGYNNNFMPY